MLLFLFLCFAKEGHTLKYHNHHYHHHIKVCFINFNQFQLPGNLFSYGDGRAAQPPLTFTGRIGHLLDACTYHLPEASAHNILLFVKGTTWRLRAILRLPIKYDVMVTGTFVGVLAFESASEALDSDLL